MLLTQALTLLLLGPPTLAQTAELLYELYSGPPQEICQSLTGIAAATLDIANQKSPSWSIYSTCIPNPGVTCANNASPSLPTGVACHLCGFTDTNCQDERQCWTVVSTGSHPRGFIRLSGSFKIQCNNS